MVARTTTKARYAYEPDFVTEPGEILQETIDSLGLTQKELAARTGYTPKHINQLVSGVKRISPDAALRLEKVTRVPARFWNNLEAQYQERKARLADRDAAAQQLEWLNEIPIRELVRRKVIPAVADKVTLVEVALEFFGVASVETWRKGWSLNQIAFRRSAGANHCSGGIAAWVRLAELEAGKIECAPFDPRKFQAAVETIRKLTTKDPDVFVPRMQQLCAKAGVALALVPEIPGTKVSGAARWLTDSKAMIAVNLRGKSNDKFWFTFFHEAGHVLNDDPGEIFVDIEYTDDPREQAANQFASETLIPSSAAEGLRGLKSNAAVTAFAERIGIHPGIVVGRLQHDGIVPYRNLNGLKVKFEWAES